MDKPKRKYQRRPYQPVPVDIAILKRLPDEGSMDGLLWDVRTSVELADALKAKNELTAQLIGRRLSTLKFHGYVVTKPIIGTQTKGHQGNLGWQITEAGKKLSNKRL